MREYREKKIGTEVSVLFEEEKVIGQKRYQVGHTREYIEVALETVEDLSGKMRNVTIKDFVNKEIMLATR